MRLGEIHTWNPHNLKGNRENQQIVDINDAVLADNGGAWDNPPEQLVWSGAQLNAARQLFATYAEYEQFGFKDPRSLLTIDGWQSLFPHIRFIGIFRHPLAVARSLHDRSGMPRDQGLELWYQYNRRLIRQYRKGAFPLLCFDDQQAEFERKLRSALDEIGLDTRDWQGEFYDRQLKSAQGDEEPFALPWKVRRLYRKLRQLAE